MNWNDLKVLLAVARAGGIASAARMLDVDDTTVTRRLAALSRSLGEDVMLRPTHGRPKLTEIGRAIAEKAAEMERAADSVSIIANRALERIHGVVRVTATPILTNRLLTPAVMHLTADYPQLTVELIPASRNLDLIMREADLALRLARPTSGGEAVLTKKIGTLEYGVYQKRGLSGSLAWIVYEMSAAALPQAKWLSSQIRAGERGATLRVADAETALGAVLAGLGRTLLPHDIASAFDDLICDESYKSPVSRDIWLLSHAAHRHRPAIRTVASWIEKTLSGS